MVLYIQYSSGHFSLLVFLGGFCPEGKTWLATLAYCITHVQTQHIDHCQTNNTLEKDLRSKSCEKKLINPTWQKWENTFYDNKY